MPNEDGTSSRFCALCSSRVEMGVLEKEMALEEVLELASEDLTYVRSIGTIPLFFSFPIFIVFTSCPKI